MVHKDYKHAVMFAWQSNIKSQFRSRLGMVQGALDIYLLSYLLSRGKEQQTNANVDIKHPTATCQTNIAQQSHQDRRH